MDNGLLLYAVIVAAIAVIAVPLEYVFYNAGLISGGAAAAAWGIGIGVALAFVAVYGWRTWRGRR
jgi:hypothetical protein